MTEVRTMLSLSEDYLTQRRALGFDLRIPVDQITAFARFVDEAAHTGPLTTRITLDWVQGQAKHAAPFSWARRLDVLRPFARYLSARQGFFGRFSRAILAAFHFDALSLPRALRKTDVAPSTNRQ